MKRQKRRGLIHAEELLSWLILDKFERRLEIYTLIVNKNEERIPVVLEVVSVVVEGPEEKEKKRTYT